MKPKQKVVIKVCMNNDASSFCCFPLRSSRSKALQVAGGFEGVQSVALVADKDQIEVTGVFDAVNLTNLLREKVGHSEIVSAGTADEKGQKPTKSGSEKKDPLPAVQPAVQPYPRTDVFVLPDPYPEPWCRFW